MDGPVTTAVTSVPVQPEPGYEPVEPVTWRATLAGVFPIVLVGLAGALMAMPGEGDFSMTLNEIGVVGLLFSYLLILTGMVIGWVKGFPRWVYSYLVYALLFALYMSNASTPGLSFWGIPLFGHELWGWRAAVPIGAAALLALILTRFSPATLARLFTNIWHDWTRLSFSFYGLLPFLAMINFDEVENTYEFPFLLLSLVILVGGAVIYMRSKGQVKAFLGLLVAAAIVTMMVTVAGSVYWQTHDMDPLGNVTPAARQPDVAAAIVENSRITMFIIGMLLSPVWIGLLEALVDTMHKRLKKRSDPVEPDRDAGG